MSKYIKLVLKGGTKRYMKKFMSCILALSISFSVVACQKQESGSKTTSSNFDIKIASNVVETYMKYLLKNDYKSAESLYSDELLKKTTKSDISSLKMFGYFISETDEVGKDASIKVRVARGAADSPNSTLDEYTIKVKKQDKDYKIDEIKSNTEKEAFYQNGTLRMRSKDNTNTNLLIKMNGLPQYTFSKDDKANAFKMVVPRNNFGVTSFSYDGDSLAISSTSKDAYVCIVKIDETMATEAGDQSQGGGQGGGQGEQGQGTLIQEKPITKKVTSIDYLKDSSIQFMTFSQDNKLVLIQYSKTGVGRCIRVYKADSGELIPTKFEELYPLDKVEVVYSSFDKDVLNYEVLPKSSTDQSVGNYIGKWQLSLKDFKSKKV